jgi:hypothetical protein
MWIFGLAAWYKMKITFKAMPTMIPSSNFKTRQAIKVAKPGSRSTSAQKKNENVNVSLQCYNFFSSLLLLHMGFTTRTSTMNMTAEMMIPARAAFGM